MASDSTERTLEWAVEPVLESEILVSAPTSLYFEIVGIDESEVELVITV